MLSAESQPIARPTNPEPCGGGLAVVESEGEDPAEREEARNHANQLMKDNLSQFLDDPNVPQFLAQEINQNIAQQNQFSPKELAEINSHHVMDEVGFLLRL